MPRRPGSFPRRRGRRKLVWLVALLFAISTTVGVLGLYSQRVLYAPGPLAEARNLVVPRGGLRELADSLVGSGLVESRIAFLVAVAATRSEGNLHAAEFDFPEHASLRTVLTILRTAKPVQHHLVIPEGLTGKQIAAILARGETLTGAADIPTEGTVLPQTYAYEFGAAREALLDRARAAMDRALASAWAERSPGLPLASAREALILASIVERETARPEERPRVAAVYLNRLRLGMKLQADPTVAYGASGGAGTEKPLTRVDLERDDPYNTYKIKGLPPGPISSPGIASIQAVTQPIHSDELYFVADGSGGHVFARTLEEHQRNVGRWRGLNPPGGPPPG